LLGPVSWVSETPDASSGVFLRPLAEEVAAKCIAAKLAHRKALSLDELLWVHTGGLTPKQRRELRHLGEAE